MGSPTEEDTANVRVGYQVATQMIVYEGQLVWRVTTVYMAFAGALILGSVALNIPGVKSPFVTQILQALLALVGVVVTFAWWSMIGRSRLYYKYWIAKARTLETSLKGVSTFTEGRAFAEGDRLSIDDEVHRMRWIHRIKMNAHLHLLYAVSLVFFLMLFFMNIVAASRAY